MFLRLALLVSLIGKKIMLYDFKMCPFQLHIEREYIFCVWSLKKMYIILYGYHH